MRFMTKMNDDLAAKRAALRARRPMSGVVAGEIGASRSTPDDHLSAWPGAVTRAFFADGDRHEMTGWKDAVIPRDVSEVDPERDIRSFDRVPRRNGPLVTFVGAVALAIVGLAASHTRASTMAYHRLAGSSLAQKATSAVQSLRQMTRPPMVDAR
ncbi:MAG TPA: hypothetical protein VHU40_03885 [Polyangia bacterium]|jgi:hypothetical protein|nr:hypothetical protein [Polyangia bacterium]